MFRSLPLLALAALAMAGCAALAEQMTADVDDYAMYRRMRTASTVERKLKASESYLQQQARGRWRSEVTRWFKGADAAYFQRACDSEARLRAYLRLLPRGPHAREARLRLEGFEQHRRYLAERERRFDESVEAYERDLARAESARRQLLLTFVRFIQHLSQTRAWGEPTWELEPSFLVDWRLRDPPARCRAQRCVKTVSLRYAIAEDREIAPRQAIFDVVVELERGLVVRTLLSGPELFSRIGEAALLRPTPPGDVMARANAISEVLALVEPVLEDAFPRDRCARQAISPVVLLRECDGKRLRIEAPPSPEEDLIVVEPTVQ